MRTLGTIVVTVAMAIGWWAIFALVLAANERVGDPTTTVVLVLALLIGTGAALLALVQRRRPDDPDEP